MTHFIELALLATELIFKLSYIVTAETDIVRPESLDVTEVKCHEALYPDEYECPDQKKDQVDPDTQEFYDCQPDDFAPVWCKAADNITCTETNSSEFVKMLPCRWTNGYFLDTALILSVFLGMMGADRFYMGYMLLGVFKMCSLGFFFVWQIIDIILIVTLTIRPVDGSHFVIPYYGNRIIIVRIDNDTIYPYPNRDWLT